MGCLLDTISFTDLGSFTNCQTGDLLVNDRELIIASYPENDEAPASSSAWVVEACDLEIDLVFGRDGPTKSDYRKFFMHSGIIEYQKN